MPTILTRLPEQTLAFLRSGYLFAERMRASRGLTAGDPRPLWLNLLGAPALLVRGREGVQLFYDESRLKRAGAMPVPVQGPLFGRGAVHTLDDEQHKHRKATFVKVAYLDEQVQRLMPVIDAEMRKTLTAWEAGTGMGNVYDDAVLTYGRAALRWAGVPGNDAVLDPWAQRLGQIVEGFGKIGPSRVVAWLNRGRCDAWAADLIQRTRSGQFTPEPGTALAEWAAFCDLDGQLLDAQTAGVELQNSTRPTIAVARFASFAAAALVQHPDWRSRIAEQVAERGSLTENSLAVAFAQEVRRVYPFVPMLPAIAREDFEWNGEQVKAGQRVLIDIRNTLTDPAEWDDPYRFAPERFLDVDDAEALEAFIPQGGAGVATGHRCPGEKIAVTVLATMIAALCTPGVELDASDIDFDPTVMPTRPSSGVRVRVSARD